MSDQLRSIELTEEITPAWVTDTAAKLDAATRAGPAALKEVLAPETCCRLLERCQKLLHVEPTLLQVGAQFEALPLAGREVSLSPGGCLVGAVRLLHLVAARPSFVCCGADHAACRGSGSGGRRHAWPVPRRLPHVSQGTSCVACTCWHADTLPRTEVLCLCSCLGGFRACGARAAAEMHRPPRTPHPCRLEVAGSPSPNNMFVINGDFVDRGAWCAHLGPVQPDQLPMRRRAARPSAAAWGTQRSLGWRVCGRSQAGPRSCRSQTALWGGCVVFEKRGSKLWQQGPSAPPAACLRCRGLETLVLLASWKLALPRHLHLLRGNHESATCTLMYGFKGELVAKYGKSHWRVRAGAGRLTTGALPALVRDMPACGTKADAAPCCVVPPAARVCGLQAPLLRPPASCQDWAAHAGAARRPVPTAAAAQRWQEQAQAHAPAAVWCAAAPMVAAAACILALLPRARCSAERPRPHCCRRCCLLQGWRM